MASRAYRSIAAVLFAALLAPFTPAGAAEDARAVAVLRASAHALGLGALPKITEMHLHGSGTYAGVPAPRIELWQSMRTGTFAQQTDAGPLTGATGWDGTTAWNRDAGGVVWDDMSENARTIALATAHVGGYLLWHGDRGGARVRWSGVRTLKNARYDVLRVEPRYGLPFTVWIDAASHLPARWVATVGGHTTVARFDDFRSVGGVRVPFRQRVFSDSGDTDFIVRDADVNPPNGDVVLRRPVEHITDTWLPSGTTTVPIALVDNHVALDVTINGKGPFHFFFDTGGSNLLDAGIAKELGVGPTGRVSAGGVGASSEAFRFATVDTLAIGGATLRHQSFLLAPVRAGFGVSSGKPVDGLIGFEVLARLVTTLDYAHEQVVFSLPEATPTPLGTIVPFVFSNTIPQIPCTIDGFAGVCDVDTGSRLSISVTSPFIAAHPSIVPANATAIGADGYGIGGPALGRLGRIEVRFAGFTLPQTIADLSTQTRGAFANPFVAGNIGAGIWKRFTITFNYRRQTMTLIPNATFAAPDTYDRSGLFLIVQNGKIVVADVRPGTPAATAGILRGDTIAAIEGKSASSYGLALIRDLFRGVPGTALPLSIIGRDGVTRTVTLTLRDYV